MFLGSGEMSLSVFDFWVRGSKPNFLSYYSQNWPIWGYPQNGRFWTYFGDNFVNIGQKHLKSRSKWPPLDLEVFWILFWTKKLKIGQNIAILLFFRHTPHLTPNRGYGEKTVKSRYFGQFSNFWPKTKLKRLLNSMAVILNAILGVFDQYWRSYRQNTSKIGHFGGTPK